MMRDGDCPSWNEDTAPQAAATSGVGVAVGRTSVGPAVGDGTSVVADGAGVVGVTVAGARVGGAVGAAGSCDICTMSIAKGRYA